MNEAAIFCRSSNASSTLGLREFRDGVNEFMLDKGYYHLKKLRSHL